jgi:hypothetical protein
VNPNLSVTVTVKTKDPAADGVPLMTPLPLMARQSRW